MSQLIIVFLLYFLIIFCIGWYAYYSTQNHADYILGGRKLSSLVTALGVGASDMSGWLMIGLPGLVYLVGLKAIWLPLGLIIGAYLNWRLVANKLRTASINANNSLTIPSYLQNVFKNNNKLLQILTALIILVFFIFYSAANFVAGGVLFSVTFGISYHSALLITVALIVVYTSIGGFLAVNWVDVFQGILMLGALIFLPLLVIYNFNIGENQKILLGHNYFAVLADPSWIGIISSLGWGLGYFGQPHILVRFMASESTASINNGRKICMSWMILALIGAVAVGVTGKIYFYAMPLPNPEEVFFELTKALVTPWVAGVLISAVLSCIMSTVSAQLILSSSAIAEDFYHSYFRPNASEAELLYIGRSAVVLSAIVALYLAWDTNSTVLKLVGHAWAGLGAAFGPVILYSLFGKNLRASAAIMGMVSGAITVIIWISLHNIYPDIALFKLYEIIPGFLLNILVIYIISKLIR